MTCGQFATASPAAAVAPDAPIRVLYVDDDGGYTDLVRSFLEDRGTFECATTTAPRDVPGLLDGVDCVVSNHRMPAHDGLEVLAAVRERDPGCPFVLFTNASFEAVAETLLAETWTDYVAKGDGVASLSLLARRIHRLVAVRRLSLLAGRAAAALENAREGLAVADARGSFQLVNRAFAAVFGYEPDELVGTSWRTLYDEATVERLESSALPPAADGWRWTGRCPVRRKSGEPAEATTSVVGLEDGGIVFAVPESDAGEAE